MYKVFVGIKRLWVSAGEFISSGNNKRFKPGREWTTELWSSDDRDDKDVRRSSPLTVGANRKLYGLRNVEAVWTVCHQRNFPGTCVPSVPQVRCTDTWWNNITATCLKHKEYRRLFHRDFSTFRPTGAYEKSEGRRDCFKKYLQDYTDWLKFRGWPHQISSASWLIRSVTRSLDTKLSVKKTFIKRFIIKYQRHHSETKPIKYSGGTSLQPWCHLSSVGDDIIGAWHHVCWREEWWCHRLQS